MIGYWSYQRHLGHFFQVAFPNIFFKVVDIQKIMTKIPPTPPPPQKKKKHPRHHELPDPELPTSRGSSGYHLSTFTNEVWTSWFRLVSSWIAVGRGGPSFWKGWMSGKGRDGFFEMWFWWGVFLGGFLLGFWCLFELDNHCLFWS